jgi:uncharacterized protein (TIGR02391 family)
MDETEKQQHISELKAFHKELKSYRRLLWSEKLSEAQVKYKDSLREKLLRKMGEYKDRIIMLTGRQNFEQFGRTFDMWADSLNTYAYLPHQKVSLDYCIDAVIEAIGKLGVMSLTDSDLQERAVPVALFDKMQFHPKVIEASRSCFTTLNYREAILNAFISLIDYIKEISELDLDGDDLMNNVFSFNYDKEQRKITKYPLIRINELKNKTDRDEQLGFMFLCKGAAAFIRNPKAHKLIVQTNPLHTLEYLAFSSSLFRQLDKRIQTYHKEQKS